MVIRVCLTSHDRKRHGFFQIPNVQQGKVAEWVICNARFQKNIKGSKWYRKSAQMPSFWVLKLRTMQFKGSKILNTCWILQIYHVQELGMSSSLCLLNPAGKHKLNPTYEETCQQKAWHQGHVAESFHVCPTERAESELALCFYSLCHPRRCVVLARRGSMSLFIPGMISHNMLEPLSWTMETTTEDSRFWSHI